MIIICTSKIVKTQVKCEKISRVRGDHSQAALAHPVPTRRRTSTSRKVPETVQISDWTISFHPLTEQQEQQEQQHKAAGKQQQASSSRQAAAGKQQQASSSRQAASKQAGKQQQARSRQEAGKKQQQAAGKKQQQQAAASSSKQQQAAASSSKQQQAAASSCKQQQAAASSSSKQQQQAAAEASSNSSSSPDGVLRRTCKKQGAVKQILRKFSVFNALTSARWMRPAAEAVGHASLASESEAEPAVLKHGWRIVIRHFVQACLLFAACCLLLAGCLLAACLLLACCLLLSQVTMSKQTTALQSQDRANGRRPGRLVLQGLCPFKGSAEQLRHARWKFPGLQSRCATIQLHKLRAMVHGPPPYFVTGVNLRLAEILDVDLRNLQHKLLISRTSRN